MYLDSLPEFSGKKRGQFGNGAAVPNDLLKLGFVLLSAALIFNRKGSGSSEKKKNWEDQPTEQKQKDADRMALNRVKQFMKYLSEPNAYPELNKLNSAKLSYPTIMSVASDEMRRVKGVGNDEARQLMHAYVELDYVFLAISRSGYGIRNIWRTVQDEPEILSIRDLVFRFNRQFCELYIERNSLFRDRDPEVGDRRMLMDMTETLREFGWALVAELTNSSCPAFDRIADIDTRNALIKPTGKIKGPLLIECSLPDTTFTHPKLTTLYNTAWSVLRSKAEADKIEEVSEKEVGAFKSGYRGMDDDKLGKLFSGIVKILRSPDAKSRAHDVKETRQGLGQDFKFVEDVLSAAGVQI